MEKKKHPTNNSSGRCTADPIRDEQNFLNFNLTCGINIVELVRNQDKMENDR
jgi:hypothetical protein